MIPCCLCHLNFTVAVPEEELIQVRQFRLSLICQAARAVNVIERKFFIYCCSSARLPAQVTVTAVAMTYDKEQTQEKTAEKPVNKGQSLC